METSDFEGRANLRGCPNVEGNRRAAPMVNEVQGMNRWVRLTAGLGHDFDVFDLARWRRNRKAIFTQTLQVKFDSLSNLRLGLCDGRARGDATRKIGNVSRVVVLRFLDNNRIAHLQPHFLSPACLKILARVPTARSSLGFPGTVTRPAFVGCLN